LIEECWQRDPSKRPTFEAIVARFSRIVKAQKILETEEALVVYPTTITRHQSDFSNGVDTQHVPTVINLKSVALDDLILTTGDSAKFRAYMSNIRSSIVAKEELGRPLSVWLLYEREMSYLKDLHVLLDILLPQMVSDSVAVPPPAVKNLFLGFEEIRKAHMRFLRSLDTICRSWNPQSSAIGKLLIDYSHEWQSAYKPYIGNLDLSHWEYQNQSKREEFGKFLK
ncbi:hypothetical protein HDU93_006251, partial [Gonapodya sp. JEL0774]